MAADRMRHIRFRVYCLSLLIFSVLSGTLPVQAIDIERFEHLNSSDGLSQNSVLSVFCDHTGFLWFGTMNGLNRYDGYYFKVYRAEPGRYGVLSNNRILSIWEDPMKFLWIKTHDGYYHYLNRSTDEFITFPRYMNSEEEKNSIITCLYSYSDKEIFLGSSNSGLYYLVYDTVSNIYSARQFVSRGISSLSNNQINFICSDPAGNIWIGTRNGLNLLNVNERFDEEPYFQHYFVDMFFTSGISSGNKLWLGTKHDGIIVYHTLRHNFESLPAEYDELKDTEITHLLKGRYDHIIIGTSDKGLYIVHPSRNELIHYEINGKKIRSVYEDYLGNLWVTTEIFGVSKVDPVTGSIKYFELTPHDIQPLVDDERQYFFEDHDHNLWIGLHGSGLALFDRTSEEFRFFRNDPKDPRTISSNFVHCLTEDHSGLLWIGTGQFNGGINKVILRNPSFVQIIPSQAVEDISENVIRSVFEDSNGCIWLATKSGKIYIYDRNLSLKTSYGNIPLVAGELPGNVYAITQDRDGYIWLGSKGSGVAVSTVSLFRAGDDYDRLQFCSYRHDPGDKTSLSSDMVYSIHQDQHKRIWIGTYGGGLNVVTFRTPSKLFCKTYDKSNSNSGSNDVRQVYEDSEGSIWIASTFGLHLLDENSGSDSAVFRIFRYDPLDNSTISYNDVIHIYEDSRKNLWIGTSGGGINLLTYSHKQEYIFEHLNQSDGLSNDGVFGILEDADGLIWFSTEDGISKYDPYNHKFENFNINDGLISSNFNENTCYRTKDGHLIFGSMNGALLIDPGKIFKPVYIPPVILTNFQLFNKDIDIHDENAPFRTTIETTRKIVLNHSQSSFSIEYAALNYFDPAGNQYSFILENFDNSWNDLKNQRKATYTNLPPGEYVFRVRATGQDGLWYGQPASLEITILPPWWKTPVARFIYIILILLCAEAGRRIFIKYQRLRNDLQVERRVTEFKLKFFTNISHEIRTPLTLVLGPLEDVRKSVNLPEAFKEPIDIMYRNGRRMLRLINQILDLRKIQNNKMKIKVRRVNYPEFVNIICSNFDHLARQKHIHFTYKPGIDQLDVWIDPEKIDSVLFNILSNAFKFTPEGKAITVSLSVNSDKNYADVTIQDEGPGIPEEKLELLFNRFTDINPDFRHLSGTGIGLSLSKELMKMHGGDIYVKSILNTGSEFTMRIPLGNKHFIHEDLLPEEDQELIEQIHHELVINEEPAVIMNPGKNSKNLPSVLVVEDNPEVQNYLVRSLQNEYYVLTAGNGEEGLRIINTYHPDVVIADIKMPEMDGLTMTRMIKENFSSSHIPVIMLTARSNLNDQIEGIESGAEAYILKPFDMLYLKTVIRNLIRQRKKVIEKYSERKNFEPGEIKITTRDEKFIEQVIKIIDANYSDATFNVEKLAQMSNVGRTVFYNKIKGLTGITPVEFLKQMRLKIAARLLQTSGYSISEIAYLSGFNDQRYFRQCFKSYYGETPSKYKLNHQRAVPDYKYRPS